MKKLLATLLISVLGLTSALAGEFEDISITDLKKAIDEKKVIVLDVNGTGSYTKKGHIPGAIDFRANAANIASLLGDDKDKLVVAYCGGPSCSAYKKGADAAEAAGFTNVKHLSAGISGWLAANQPVEKPKSFEELIPLLNEQIYVKGVPKLGAPFFIPTARIWRSASCGALPEFRSKRHESSNRRHRIGSIGDRFRDRPISPISRIFVVAGVGRNRRRRIRFQTLLNTS